MKSNLMLSVIMGILLVGCSTVCSKKGDNPEVECPVRNTPVRDFHERHL